MKTWNQQIRKTGERRGKTMGEIKDLRRDRKERKKRIKRLHLAMVQGDTVKEEEEIINNGISEQDEFKYRTRPEQPPLKNELQQNNRYLLSVDKAP